MADCRAISHHLAADAQSRDRQFKPIFKADQFVQIVLMPFETHEYMRSTTAMTVEFCAPGVDR